MHPVLEEIEKSINRFDLKANRKVFAPMGHYIIYKRIEIQLSIASGFDDHKESMTTLSPMNDALNPHRDFFFNHILDV